MSFYKQIAVIVLFFTIQILFFIPNYNNLFIIILKGLASGGLVVILISYAFPSVFKGLKNKKNLDVDRIPQEEKDYKWEGYITHEFGPYHERDGEKTNKVKILRLKLVDNTGKKIDKRARKFLNKSNLDYAHGTGHGVGFFLNVHEGPQSITKINTVKIREGMILSNEPGYYKTNEYGIRIENLVYVKKIKKNLSFQNLTMAPIEKDLINFDLLTIDEKNYLFKYHLEVYSRISKYLNPNERSWLATFI